MRKTLDFALNKIFSVEAGYQDNRVDKGNWYKGQLIGTNRGIAAPTLAAWIGEAPTPTRMRNLSAKTARAILEARYAMPIYYDQLPAGLDYALLDFAVNSGPRRAIKELQQSMQEVKADGVMGGMTLKAILKYDPKGLIRALASQRLSFLKNLSNYWKFGKGWKRRVNTVTHEAIKITTPVASK